MSQYEDKNMETTTLPPDVLDVHIKTVRHAHHREHLHHQLGRLAETRAQQPYGEYDQPEREYSPRLRTQAEMLADFFAKASGEAGPEATEDMVWDRVFERQLEELSSNVSEIDKEALAVNMLAGNLLYIHGLEPDEEQDALDGRMWSIAGHRLGLLVMRAAHEHMDICVATSDPDAPYESIVEQTEDFGGLFMATDEAVDLSTVNMPVYELTDATPAQQAWFIGIMGAHGNYTSVQRNLEFVPDKRALCEALVANGRLTSELLTSSGLDSVVSQREAVDLALDRGMNPDDMFKIADMSPADQIHVFERVLKEQADKLDEYVGWQNPFTALGYDQLKQLLDNGASNPFTNLNITGFRNLPPGALEELRERGVSNHTLCQSMSNFPLEEALEFYDGLVASGGFDIYDILSYPDQFGFVGKDVLLQVARETDLLSAVANNIEGYTDGSDKQLLLELIDAGMAEELANHLGDLSSLDADWFVQTMLQQNEIGALIKSLAHTNLLDQRQLLEMALDSTEAESLLRYDLLHFTDLDTDAVLDRLLAQGLFTVVASNADYFEDYTPGAILERLPESQEVLEAVVVNIVQYDSIDHNHLIDMLARQGMAVLIGSIADVAVDHGVDPEKIWSLVQHDAKALLLIASYQEAYAEAIGEARMFDALTQTADLADIGYKLHKFTDTKHHQAFVDRCFSQKNMWGLRACLGNILIPGREIMERCCTEGWLEPLVAWPNSLMFFGIGKEEAPTEDQLHAGGAGAVMLCNPYAYPDPDKPRIFQGLVDHGSPELIAAVAANNQVANMPPGIAQRLLSSHSAFLIVDRKEAFDPAVFTPDFVEAYMETGGDRSKELYVYAGHKIDWVEKALALFGPDAPPKLLLMTRDLSKASDEPLPQEFTELGIKQRGQGGLDQLKRAASNIRAQLVYGPSSPDELARFVGLCTDNRVAKSLAQQLTRFTTSEWGLHKEDDWDKVLRTHLAVSGEIRPLSSNFVPSGPYTIRTLDAAEFDPSKIDEDAAVRFDVLRASVDEALQIAEMPSKTRYRQIFASAKQLLDAEGERLADVRRKLEAEGKHKALRNIDRQITALDAVRDLPAKEFLAMCKNNIGQLTSLKTKGLDHIVRTGAFARAIRRSPQAHSLARQLAGTQPTFEGLVAMTDFVEHTVNNEVYKNYFDNDESRKVFMGLSDTTALRKQIAKTQAGQASGRSTLQFVPSRGPLLELSGHIGDACWASKYESIGKEFPNITAVAYLRNPGQSTERLVGSGLLIETKDESTGEDIVVLRGINPIENYINGVKVEDFLDSLVDYAKRIAGNRRVAMVIDGKSGQAATNRPVLHNYLVTTVKQMRAGDTPLRLPKDTTFNHYELSQERRHPVYYID